MRTIEYRNDGRSVSRETPGVWDGRTSRMLRGGDVGSSSNDPATWPAAQRRRNPGCSGRVGCAQSGETRRRQQVRPLEAVCRSAGPPRSEMTNTLGGRHKHASAPGKARATEIPQRHRLAAAIQSPWLPTLDGRTGALCCVPRGTGSRSLIVSAAHDPAHPSADGGGTGRREARRLPGANSGARFTWNTTGRTAGPDQGWYVTGQPGRLRAPWRTVLR